MTGSPARTLTDIRLLTFSAMGVRMAVDAEEVSAIVEPEEADKKGIEVFGFGEKLSFRKRNVQMRAPKVLIGKDSQRKGILIDQPEDIVSVSIGKIRPLPPILESCLKGAVIWGAAIIGGRAVLLVDLQRLFGLERHGSTN